MAFRWCGLSLASVCAWMAVSAQAATLFSEDFEAYADTAAMNAAWSNSGTATLGTGLGNPGQSMIHPGTAGSFAGANTSSFSVASAQPVGSQILTYSADIHDDGTSANKCVSAGLRAAAGVNITETGMYNDPSHYAHRTVLFAARKWRR